MSAQRIVIAGGSGFIGTALAQEFSRRGYEVVVLTRSPRERTDAIREMAWDAKQPGDWVAQLDGAAAVINLTGKNINCPHTPENLSAIASSRVEAADAIAAASAQAARPPRVWVQASAIGFYGDTQDRSCDESAPNGTDPLANICRQWEAAGTSLELPQTRRVVLRIGFVLGNEGGALPVLARLTKWFLGGEIGSGHQFISWIHLADLVAMFVTVVEQESLVGTFNAVAPNAVMNREFMRNLRRALHRPWSPPVPMWAVKLGAKLMGSEPSLACISQRCVPKRFQDAKFRFLFPGVAATLRDLCRKS